MRIIGGRHRGRRLAKVKGTAIRPTADRIREAVFNIIGQRVADALVLDLFAGTGAFGIEALSRGAKRAIFIDASPAALDVIKKNIMACRLETDCRLIKWNATDNLNHLLQASPCHDLIFMDPPYDCGFVAAGLKSLKSFQAVNQHTLLVVEHSIQEPLPASKGMRPLTLTDQRRYGKTLVSFFIYML